MNDVFFPVRCPECARRGENPAPVAFEIEIGRGRGKCPRCKLRIWAMSDGRELRILMVDAPRARLVTSA